MNQKLVEICLRVRDIDATLDFYTNLFDFEVASHRKFPENKFDLIFVYKLNIYQKALGDFDINYF